MHIENMYCPYCGTSNRHYNGKCDECSNKETRLEEARWAALTDREQVQELLKRVKILERGEIRY